jgi:hypothetical protein
MVCFRAQRPFSLDFKLPDLNEHLANDHAPCEVRLLAIVPEWRSTTVCRRLLANLARFAYERGHDVALISGTTRQVKLYEHLGFEPFGPLVGSKDAPYQPMRLRLETFLKWTSLRPGPRVASQRRVSRPAAACGAGVVPVDRRATGRGAARFGDARE